MKMIKRIKIIIIVFIPSYVIGMKKLFIKCSSKSNENNFIQIVPSENTPVTPENKIEEKPLLKDQESQSNNFFQDFAECYRREKIKSLLERNKKLIKDNVSLKKKINQLKKRKKTKKPMCKKKLCCSVQ